MGGGAVTVGASSGNEVVVRARGVAGRHLRILERDGGYFVDLFKGVDPIRVNGRAFLGGLVGVGDRIAVGEATITLVSARPMMRSTPVGELPLGDVALPSVSYAVPGTEIEYRGMRLEASRICRSFHSPEEIATELAGLLDRELPQTEWAVGLIGVSSGFRPLASTFRETPAVPPRLIQEISAGESVARSESVTGVLTLVAEPHRGDAPAAAILVRESPRLPARAILLLEELARMAGIALSAEFVRAEKPARAGEPEKAVVVPLPAPAGTPEQPQALESAAATVLRQSDDLKKIVETVEREVIDRAMRRM
ncbi:MAG TPA: FHA domain-containing protein, partial [Thermoanaerobaculia bacterium]|nr:FHA domain-containing protein [Thermoanaerobaculia bacterium]